MNQYFYSKDNYKYGPFSLQQLREKNLSADCLVWKAGTPKWITADQMEELQNLSIESAPPVPHYMAKNKKKVAIEVFAGYSAVIAIFVAIICLFIFNPYKFDASKYKEVKGISTVRADAWAPVYSPLWWSEGFYEYCDDKVGFNPYFPHNSYAQRKEYLTKKAIKFGFISFVLCFSVFLVYRYVSRPQS